MFRKLMVLAIFSSLPLSANASDALNCKVYNEKTSAELSTETSFVGSTMKSELVFTNPVSWYHDLLRFELVYSSGGADKDPQLFVANGTSADGHAQTVVINLAPLQGNVRYGELKAGDFKGDVNSTLKKRQTYDIQCFYSP